MDGGFIVKARGRERKNLYVSRVTMLLLSTCAGRLVAGVNLKFWTETRFEYILGNCHIF